MEGALDTEPQPAVACTRLSSHPTSSAAARRFVRDVLYRWRVMVGDEVVLLCTDELVTNAIVHVGSDVELVMRNGEGVVRIEVHDRSPRPPLRRVPDEDEESGRGLQLVDALASRWGVEPVGAGKSVWFEVAVESDAASVPSSGW
ncbi:MAG: hypothetical protein QOI20_2871 [Acidimicrobiaceae bacterium]|jgi:anti-sigma regulatory factor (Ser/Thr protein kinase)|nr:hypothetical protein [Acidimicrobiaceae bacterium]